MTREFVAKLSSSDVVNSLRMEAKVCQLLIDHGWDASRSAYYIDESTGKLREIDIHARKYVSDDSRMRKGTNAPLVDLSLFVECKSLAGKNIIFTVDDEPEYNHGLDRYWVGYDEEIRLILNTMADALSIEAIDSKRMLYRYLTKQAYDIIPASDLPTQLPSPSVDIVSRSFRETRDGTSKEKDTQNGESVVWKAALRLFSAIDAGKKFARERCISTIADKDAVVYRNDNQFIDFVGFFLGAEINRNVYFHPILAIKSKLWAIMEDGLNEIRSCRVFFDRIDWKLRYVDIVSDDYLDNYIKDLSISSEKSARDLIAKQWACIEEYGWSSDRSIKKLHKILTKIRSHALDRKGFLYKG